MTFSSQDIHRKSQVLHNNGTCIQVHAPNTTYNQTIDITFNAAVISTFKTITRL